MGTHLSIVPSLLFPWENIQVDTQVGRLTQDLSY